MTKKQDTLQHRWYRCRSCGHEFPGWNHDVMQSASKAASSASRASDGLFGSLVAAVFGAAASATGAMVSNAMESKCPSCGSAGADLIPAYYTVVDYDDVQRFVNAAYRKRVKEGERGFEFCWAKAHEMASVPHEQHRMPFVEPRNETLATHRAVAEELYHGLSGERRALIEAHPHVDWVSVIRLRARYESFPPHLRLMILRRSREVQAGQRALASDSFYEGENLDAETFSSLLHEYEAIERESEAPVVDANALDKILTKAMTIQISKGPLEHEAFWFLHYRLGSNEEAWREARERGESKTTMATHRGAADQIFPNLSAETRARFAARSDVDWALVLMLRELYRTAKKRQRANIRACVGEFEEGHPSSTAIDTLGVSEIDAASLGALRDEIERVLEVEAGRV